MIETVSQVKDADDFCILSENILSSVLIDDDFIWVMDKGPVSYSSHVLISHDEKKTCDKHTERTNVTKNTDKEHNICVRKNMSDFGEDFVRDKHWNELEFAVEKATQNKKYCAQQRLRQRQATFLKTTTSPVEYNEISHPAFSTFDGATTEILRSIFSHKNYYRGYYGDIVGNGANSLVIHAYICIKQYPTWEPGAKPILIYAFINDKFNKRYRMWRSTENAVKVYKLSNDKIKNERIFQQVQKEKEHLLLLYKAKFNVPEVMRCSRNIIVMSMIGTDQKTAPSITSIPLKHSQDMYHTIVNEMKMWYNTLNLVHGKLCSRNILYWNDQLYYIGWSQSVRREHPLALKKLMRDCCFVTKFFERRDIPVTSVEMLFRNITGLNEMDNSVLNVNHSKDLWRSRHLENPNRTVLSNIHSPGRNCRFK